MRHWSRRRCNRLAVAELERQLREQRETRMWERAAADPRFVAEAADIDAAYAAADRETWPA